MYYENQERMAPLTPEQQELERIEEEKKAKDKKKKKEQKKAGKGKGKQSERDQFTSNRGAFGPSEELKKVSIQINKFQNDWAMVDETKNFK